MSGARNTVAVILLQTRAEALFGVPPTGVATFYPSRVTTIMPEVVIATMIHV